MLQTAEFCYIIILYVILIEWRIVCMEMQMEWSYVFAVVLTGMIVVFAALVILILFISAVGKLFESMKQNKKSKEIAQIKSEPVKAPVETIETAEEPEEIIETDNNEVIAVIAAAVAMMAEADNTSYRIKSVKPARNIPSNSRNAWAMAGLRENTNPF